MSVATITPDLMTRLLSEVRQDLGILYGMEVKNPHEPEPVKKLNYADNGVA